MILVIFVCVAIAAVSSFLNFGRAAAMALIPASLFGVPTLAAGVFAHNGVAGGFWLIPLRIEVAVTLALVMTESIGLIRLSHLLGRGPLGVAWLTMVQQIRVMAKHAQDLEFARRSRLVSAVGARERRRQVGMQAGSFLVKCMMSAESRSLGLRSRGVGLCPDAKPDDNFRVGDWALVAGGVIMLAGGVLW